MVCARGLLVLLPAGVHSCDKFGQLRMRSINYVIHNKGHAVSSTTDTHLLSTYPLLSLSTDLPLETCSSARGITDLSCAQDLISEPDAPHPRFRARLHIRAWHLADSTSQMEGQPHRRIARETPACAYASSWSYRVRQIHVSFLLHR